MLQPVAISDVSAWASHGECERFVMNPEADNATSRTVCMRHLQNVLPLQSKVVVAWNMVLLGRNWDLPAHLQTVSDTTAQRVHSSRVRTRPIPSVTRVGAC
jgi:hypothetical protein